MPLTNANSFHLHSTRATPSNTHTHTHTHIHTHTHTHTCLCISLTAPQTPKIMLFYLYNLGSPSITNFTAYLHINLHITKQPLSLQIHKPCNACSIEHVYRNTEKGRIKVGCLHNYIANLGILKHYLSQMKCYGNLANPQCSRYSTHRLKCEVASPCS